MKKVNLILVVAFILQLAIIFMWPFSTHADAPVKKSVETILTTKEGEFLVTGMLTKASVVGVSNSGQPTIMLEFEDGFILLGKGGAWTTCKLKTVNNFSVWKTSGEIKNIQK